MIWFVRHGQTDMNALGIVQGTIDVPLNEQGREQAREVKEHLKDIKFDVVYSSPLKRAAQTAEIIGGAKIVVDERLKEHYGGIRQGLKYSDWDDEKKKDYKQHPEKYGAESYENFYNRVIGFYKEIENTKKNILIVSHYVVYKFLRAYLGQDETPISNCEAVLLKK